MIVEFLGTSGAGKSTFIPILTNILRDDGLTAMSATEAIHSYMRKTCIGRLVCFLMPQALQGPSLWRVFSYFIVKFCTAQFALKNPRLISDVVRSQLYRPIPWRHRQLILRLFFQMTGWRQFLERRRQPTDTLVFDEGFVHRATHMFASESERPNVDQVVAYLKRIPRLDLVIWVQAPLDACLARIYARGLQTRLRGLETSEVVQFLANAEQVVNIAAQYLNNTGSTVIQLENKGDLTASTSELRCKLSEYWFSQPDLYHKVHSAEVA
jgi:thymidylate kinase